MSAIPSPFGVKSAIATLVRHINNSEEPTQVVLSNIPEWASEKLIHAILLLDLCQDEYSLYSSNPDADLSKLYMALTSTMDGVVDAHNYDCYVNGVVYIDEAQVEALSVLKGVLLVYPCDFYQVLQQLYDFIQCRILDDVFTLEMIHTHNKDIATVLSFLIGYYDAGVSDLSLATTLIEDLKQVI